MLSVFIFLNLRVTLSKIYLGLASELLNSKYILLYRPVLGRRWALVMVGHISWVHERRGPGSRETREPRCRRVRAMWHRTSVTQATELGHVRWIPDHTPVINREKPRSRGVHACGVNDAFRRSTSKVPLEELRPVRVTFQG